MNPERQLELFGGVTGPAPVRHREALGRLLVQLRYDHLVLAGMAGLMGLTIVFACGVERGKQLVRSERILLVRQGGPTATSPAQPSEERHPVAPATTTQTQPEVEKKAPGVPPRVPKRKEPSKLAARPTSPTSTEAGKTSRYAIQVVTYSQVQRARRELERLQARGERAFLVMRNGHTVVFVGPFPSKGNAKEKLTVLRSQYQDCFVKTL